MLFRSGFVGRQIGGRNSSGPPGVALDLSFMIPGTLDPRITFTRASIGTYYDVAGVLQTAGVNLILQSTDVSQAVWTKAGGLVVSGNVTAPDGSNTGQMMTIGPIATNPRFYQLVAVPTGVRSEPSFWINPVSTSGTLVVENPALNTAGHWTVNMALLTPGVWQRITRNNPAVTITSEFVGSSNSAGNYIFNTGAVGITAAFWGHQHEIGTTSGPYAATTTVTNGAPRWDYDPVTHALRGLLIEEQRINTMLQSGDFTNAAWNKGNCTLSAGTIGPNGAVTGSGMISNNGTTGLLSENSTSVAGTTYTSSCFVRPGTLSSVTMLMPLVWWTDAANRTATYNLSTGIVTQVLGGTASAAMVPVGGGWYRVSLTATPDLSVSGAVRFAGASAVGDGVSVQHYAFGAQLEVGAFATSYIPTTAAAVTRIADRASLPTGPWYSNPAALSFVTDMMVMVSNCGGVYVQLDDGTNNSRAVVLSDGGATNAHAFENVGGVTTYNLTVPGPLVVGSLNKFGYVSASAQHFHGLNGATATLNTNAAAPPTINTMRIGSPVGATVGAMYIQRVRYWPRALSNSELQQVTT